MTCRKCSRELTRDEIAITRKMVNRGCTEFLCAQCLAREFHITVDEVYRLIERFRAAGCSLFQ